MLFALVVVVVDVLSTVFFTLYLPYGLMFTEPPVWDIRVVAVAVICLYCFIVDKLGCLHAFWSH